MNTKIATKIFTSEQLRTFNFPVVREEMRNSRGNDTGFDNIFNKVTGESLGVVSREYSLITHAEAINVTFEKFQKAGLPEIEPVRVRVSAMGARMFAEFKFKQDIELGFHATEDRKVGDIIAPGFKIVNSYDRSTQISLSAFILRLICTNGATVTDQLYAEGRRHFKNLNIDEMVSGFVNGFGNFQKKVIPHVVSLSKQEVSPVILQDELNSVPGFMQDETLDYLENNKFIKFQDRDGETEIEIIKKMSNWDLLNSFTWVLSHSENVGEERRNVLSTEISERFGL